MKKTGTSHEKTFVILDNLAQNVLKKCKEIDQIWTGIETFDTWFQIFLTTNAKVLLLEMEDWSLGYVSTRN